jgi:hypothetical protein
VLITMEGEGSASASARGFGRHLRLWRCRDRVD